MKGVVVVAVTALLLLLLVAGSADATLSKADRAALKYKDGPRNISVIEAGLVRENVRSIDILKWHKMYHDKKSINFDGEVLGYVTPWNNHGYDIAKTFAKKLSIVSPVWLQLQPAAQGSAKIGGLQDLDRKWMAEVKKSDHNNTLIMPRLILHEWSRSSLEWLLNNARSRQGVVDKIVHLCEEYKFDGLVFEILSQVSRADYKQALVFIEEIGTAMHQKDKRFILVVPPSGRPNALSKTDFQRLIPFVDRFSLMTYDYSTGGSSGPNAPIRWVEECVLHLAPNATHRSKILLGLNFYGMDFTRKEGKPILGREVIGQLERNTPTIMWDATAKEHSFMYYSDTDHQVFYPTLQSIKVRLDLAESLGTGISIWDIGQGLDYFWDLF